MTVYIDSTIAVRRLLGIGETPAFWGKWDKAYASSLLRTECLRAANTLRLKGTLDDAGRARFGEWVETLMATVTEVAVTDGVVRRAAESFPVVLGTLPALHLATMLELQSVHGVTCALASDDEALVRAAKAMGFPMAACAAESAAAADAMPVEK